MWLIYMKYIIFSVFSLLLYLPGVMFAKDLFINVHDTTGGAVECRCFVGFENTGAFQPCNKDMKIHLRESLFIKYDEVQFVCAFRNFQKARVWNYGGRGHCQALSLPTTYEKTYNTGSKTVNLNISREKDKLGTYKNCTDEKCRKALFIF